MALWWLDRRDDIRYSGYSGISLDMDMVFENDSLFLTFCGFKTSSNTVESRQE
jgi:hypothetical protein